MEYQLREISDVFSAQASDTTSSRIVVKNYDAVVILIGTAASTNGTLKICGSVDETADLSSAQSTSNLWDYVGSYDLDSGSFIAGATGISPGGSAVYYQLKLNVDKINQIALEISSITAGSYTAKVYGAITQGK